MTHILENLYLDACLLGDTETIRNLITKENKTLKTTRLLYKYLSNTCTGGHYDTFDILYQYAVHKLDIGTLLSRTFDCACRGGSLSIVNKLTEILTNKCNVDNNKDNEDDIDNEDYVDDVDMEALWNDGMHAACAYGKLEIIRFYIDKLVNSTETKFNCIYGSCESGSVELLSFLIMEWSELFTLENTDKADKAEAKIGINWGWCFENACASGNIEMVHFIIECGSKYGAVYDISDWWHGLEEACCGNNIEIIKFCIEKGALNFEDCLYDVCMVGNIEIVNFLVNCLEKKGVTNFNEGLCGACYGNKIEIIELMITKGATDWNGGLNSACSGGHIEIVKLMVEKGANDWDGGADSLDECLQTACSEGDLELAKLLIERGAVDFENGLLYACAQRHTSLVKLMLNYGPVGLDSVLNSVCGECSEIDNLLISAGADKRLLKYTNDFKLYSIYRSFYKNEVSATNNKWNKWDDGKYMNLLQEYPPCVLYVGCKLTKNNKCCIKKLPLELFRLLNFY